MTSSTTPTESLRKDAGIQQQIPLESSNATTGTFRVSPRKANAALVILARNSDLKGVLESMKHMENTFNKRFQYPWVFLNEEPFSDDFKKYVFMIQFLINFSPGCVQVHSRGHRILNHIRPRSTRSLGPTTLDR